jgi:VCBS repeat-containing protein
MAKTYKILVNDGKGTDIKPVGVEQGVGAKGEPVHLVAKRGWRFQLQDELKGKGLAPDQVRLKRVGKDLAILFDGSQRADVVIEDYYAENTDKDKDNGMPTLVGNAENGGMYEYVPQDPAISSMPAELKDGNTPVIVSLGGGPLGDDFVLSALPLVAAAGGVSGWLVAGGVAAAAAAGGGGGGGGSGAAVVVVPAKATGSLTHDATNDTGVLPTDSITNNKTPVLTINAEHGAKVVVTVNGKEYTATETSTAGVYTVPVTDELKDGTYTPTIKVTNSAGSTTSDGTPFIVDLSTFTDPNPADPFNPPVANKSGLRVVIDTDANNDGFINGKTELASDKKVMAKVLLTKDAAVGDVITVTITVNGDVKETRKLSALNAQQVKDGAVSLDVLTDPVEGAKISIAASIKDDAGNSSPSPDASDTAIFTALTPTVAIEADKNNDGFINKDELNGTTTLSVKTELTGNAIVNDVVKVVLTISAADGISKYTKEFSHTLNATDIANSFVTDSFGKPAESSTIEVSATMNGKGASTDKAVLDTSSFVEPFPVDPFNPVDPKKTGLRVSIDTDKNNDAIINSSELVATGGKVSATVTLTQDAAVGDLVTITATGNTPRMIIVTQAHIDAGRQIKLNDLEVPAEGGTITVTASIKDKAGNASLAPDAIDSATLNTTIPTVSIETDTNNDGFINKNELNSSPTVSVKIDVPINAKVDDVIYIVANGAKTSRTLSAEDIKNASFKVTFATLADGATLTVTATHKPAAGAMSSEGRDTALIDISSFVNPLDSKKSSLVVQITTDSNDDGFINSDELKTSGGLVKASVTLGADVAVGDLVTVTAMGNAPRSILVTQAHIDAGRQIKLEDLVAPAENGTITVTANVQDKAGNKSPITASDSAVLDTIAPEPVDPLVDPTKQVKLEILKIAEDNILNESEIAGKVTIVGKVTGEFQVNDEVTITTVDVSNTPHKYSAKVDANGNFIVIDVLGKDLSEDANLKIDGILVAHDKALNASTVTATKTYAKAEAANGGLAPTVLILEDKNNDGFLDEAETLSSGKLSVTVSFDKNKVLANDKVVLSDGQMITLTTEQAQAGFVSFTSITPPVDGATLTVNAHIETVAGNKSPEGADQISIDGNAVNHAAIAITSITDDTGVANDFITADSGLVYGGTLSNFTSNGAKVKLLLHNKTNGNVLDISESVVVSGVNATNKTAVWSWDRHLIDQVDGVYSLTATLVNANGVLIPGLVAQEKEIIISQDSLVANPDSVTFFEAGGLNNAIAGASPSGLTNLLTNDTVLAGVAKQAVVQVKHATKYGLFELHADGTYVYELNQENASVQALKGANTLTDTIAYEAQDTTGKTSMANLVVTIAGANDAATIFSSGQNDVTMQDVDAGDQAFNLKADHNVKFMNANGSSYAFDSVAISTQDSTKFTGTVSYLKGTVSSAVLKVHEIFTVTSVDETSVHTFDFVTTNSTTSNKVEYYGANGNKDTLFLKDLFVANQLLDLSGANSDLKLSSVEKLSMQDAANQIIKVDVSTIEQAGSTALHQLFVDGNAGDQVQLVNGSHVLMADTTSVPGYDRYVVDSTHELLIQHAITISFIS